MAGPELSQPELAPHPRHTVIQGPFLPRLVAWLYQERSRLGLGDFALTAPTGGTGAWRKWPLRRP